MPPAGLTYTLGAPLGGGGFADVFDSVAADGAPVVIKVARYKGGDRLPTSGDDFPAHGYIDSSHTGTWHEHVFNQDEIADVIEVEAQSFARAAGRRLPHLLDRIVVDRRPALVLERLSRRWDLTTAAPEAFADLLEAAGDLTSTGLACHGDLKPQHVFLDGRGDFTFIDPAYGRADHALRVATPEFNPLLVTGPAADVVAVAVMIYLQYVGELPPVSHRSRSSQPALAAVSPAPGGLAEWVDAVLTASDAAALPSWASDHLAAATALREGVGRPVVESAAYVIPRTTAHVSTHMPYGWQITESWTLRSRTAPCDIVVECASLSDELDTQHFAATHGDALQRELRAYREHSVELMVVTSGQEAIVRDFEFVTTDGRRIHQLQLYLAGDGLGVTATAASPSEVFDDVLPDIITVFQSLTFA